ncbi:MAG: ribosomal protein S18 acetylase RimI-like enzyme [Granulosicoccus sp.]|jgi:ribosomal protein S18 acetylase RimI-like enzyme
MQQIIIRSVEKHDLSLLDSALRALSDELGDQHPACIDFLEQAGFGSTPAFYALIAVNATNTLCGAVVFSPVMSTTLGTTGVYVSDLWVAQMARSCGLGKRLLSHAADDSYARWGAKYLKLAVYDGSPRARQFYDRLGLIERQGEKTMFLDKLGVDALRRL